MNIDVNARRVDRKREHEHRLRLYVQYIGISRFDGMLQHTITDESTVHKEKLFVGSTTRSCGQPHPSFEMKSRGIGRDRSAGVLELLRHHGKHALGCGLSRQMQTRPPVRKNAEAYRRIGQGHTFDLSKNMRGFGRRRLQKLASGGRQIKKVLHFNASAFLAGRRNNAVAADGPGFFSLGCSACDRHVGYRIDGSQRFPSEAETRDALKISERTNFACGVTLKGQRQVFLRDPAAVVGHHDALNAALFQTDFNIRCTGVQ